jgi:hypothetical protein
VAAEPKTIKINLAQGKRDPGGAKMNHAMTTKIRIFFYKNKQDSHIIMDVTTLPPSFNY